MPQQLNQTIRTTLSKGLLTEYSELNFPEDASIDELNCELLRTGNRTRRLAVEQETNGAVSSETYSTNSIVSINQWSNVGEEEALEYLVVQVGSKLRFYQKGVFPISSAEVPISDTNSNPYIVELSNYNSLFGNGASSSKVQCVSFKGRLIVVGPDINAFYITRNEDSTFTRTTIDFKIRDFTWFGSPDTRFNPIAIDNTTSGRIYDLQNAGWVGTKGMAALDTYRTDSGGFNPPLTHPWYSGKDANGDFSYAEYNKVYSGNSLTANGHFIVDLFYDALPQRPRTVPSSYVGVDPSFTSETTVSFYDGTPVENLTTRFSCAAVYAGRVFFSGADGRVYFTRVLDNIKEIGDLYQVNDPTSEDFPDLLATDGGWVSIPEASSISRLHVYGSSLFAFAENGVWRLSGVDDVFRATEFSINKITDYGLAYPDSFVSGSNNVPFWWSFLGIHTVVVDDNGYFREVNISRTTIQSFVDDISGSQKSTLVGVFDGLKNKVAWFYSDNAEPVVSKLNNILFFDIDLSAFYPWRISDSTNATSYVVGADFFKGYGKSPSVLNVVDENGNNVVDGEGNNVVVTRDFAQYTSSDLNLVCLNSTGNLFFAKFSSVSFLDWGDADYQSYLETSYNFVADLARQKTSPYITVLMRVTETGFVLNGATYELVRNSSLRVSSYWDFLRTPSQNPQEAYRFTRPIVVNPSNLSTFEYPNTVLNTRLKLRGRGRVFRLRFESSTGKDFNLLGWETLDAVNPSY